MGIKGRRSDLCLKVSTEQSKSKDPLDQALAQINLIVRMVNRRMEDLTSSDLQRNAARSLEAYLNKVESGELEHANLEAPLHLRDDGSDERKAPILRIRESEASHPRAAKESEE